MKRWGLMISCLFMISLLVSGQGFGKDYPERPVTLLVGFAPGGSLDLSARSLAAAAEKILGKPIVIENKTGGTGAVALAAMLSQPDGHTLVATPSSVLIRVSQLQEMPFKPLKDFKSIIGYASPELGIVVKADSPWKTLKDLSEYAAKNPGKIKYATTGVGSTTHAAMDEITLKDNLQLIHIPYKGSNEAITALLGGHVEVASVTSEFIPYVKNGQVRLLSTMGDKRSPKFPDAPTMKESGYDFENDAIYSIVGPANLPAPIVKKLEEVFKTAGENKEYKDALDKIDLAPVFYDNAAFDAFLKTNWQKINKHLTATGKITQPATKPE